MNRKQLIILVLVSLLLGGLAYYFSNSYRQQFDRREAGIGEKLLGDFPANDVALVTITSHDGTVNLAKQEGWIVKERSGYPAAFTQIAELVRKLWELKPVQSQNVGASQWSRLDLVAPDAKDAGTNTATLLELKGKDGKTIRSLLLGRRQMRESEGQFGGFPVGRWVAVPDRKETVYVVSEAFSDVEPKAENWLNKDFFKVEKLKAISLVSTNATNSWSLSRTNETDAWVLADRQESEELDKNKLSSFNWALSSPSFNDVYPKDADPVKDAFAAPSLVKLETLEGFDYEVKVGSAPDNDSLYLTVATKADLPKERAVPADEKPEDKEKNEKAWKDQQDKLKEKLKKEQALQNWVFKVSKWTVDSVLKNRSALMTEKKPDPGTNAPPTALAPPLPGPVSVSPTLVPPEEPPK